MGEVGTYNLPNNTQIGGISGRINIDNLKWEYYKYWDSAGKGQLS